MALVANPSVWMAISNCYDPNEDLSLVRVYRGQHENY